MENGQSVPKVKSIALNTLITEQEMKQVNYLRDQLKTLENKELSKAGR